MNPAEIEAKLLGFINHQLLEGQGGDLGVSTPLFELGILDSFAFFTLVDYISQEFKVTLELESVTAEQFRDVSSIARILHSKGVGGSPGRA